MIWAFIVVINIYKLKKMYQYKHNNLTHRIYENDCFNKEECFWANLVNELSMHDRRVQ